MPLTESGQDIRSALRIIDAQFAAALSSGVDHVNDAAFSPAWESVSAWRQTAIIWLIRKVGKRLADNSLSREVVLARFCDIVFRYFGRRYVALAFDVYLIMSSGAGTPADSLKPAKGDNFPEQESRGPESDLAVPESAIMAMNEIVEVAKRSSYATPGKLDAMIMGMSGMYYYYPDRLMRAAVDQPV